MGGRRALLRRGGALGPRGAGGRAARGARVRPEEPGAALRAKRRLSRARRRRRGRARQPGAGGRPRPDERRVRAAARRPVHGVAALGRPRRSSCSSAPRTRATPAKRAALRRQAADLYANQLGDKDAARETWRKILEDGDDEETTEHLDRRRHRARGPRRGGRRSCGGSRRPRRRGPTRRASRCARPSSSPTRWETSTPRSFATSESSPSSIPTCRLALQAIADLQEARDNAAAAANALERELKLVTDPTERAPIGTRLASLYERIGDPRSDHPRARGRSQAPTRTTSTRWPASASSARRPRSGTGSRSSSPSASRSRATRPRRPLLTRKLVGSPRRQAQSRRRGPGRALGDGRPGRRKASARPTSSWATGSAGAASSRPSSSSGGSRRSPARSGSRTCAAPSSASPRWAATRTRCASRSELARSKGRRPAARRAPREARRSRRRTSTRCRRPTTCSRAT